MARKADNTLQMTFGGLTGDDEPPPAKEAEPKRRKKAATAKKEKKEPPAGPRTEENNTIEVAAEPEKPRRKTSPTRQNAPSRPKGTAKRTSNGADGILIANELSAALKAGPATLTLEDTVTSGGWVAQDCIEEMAKALENEGLLQNLTIRPNRAETAETIKYVRILTGLEIKLEGQDAEESDDQ